jgi:heptosyltransferase-1
MSKEHPKRILVIRFGAIGDIILTFPAIMALKKAWPDAHITYLTKEKFSPLVTPQSFIDDVLCLEPNESIQSLRAKVAAAGIDGIIDLHGQLRSKALRSFNTIPTLAQKIPRSLWESSSVRLGWALHQPKSKIVEDHHRVMDSVVGHRLDREKIHFQVSPQQKAAAQARLHQAGFNFKQKTLGISPGANWFTKRWSSERFSEVAKRAKAEGFQVLTVGSPAEEKLAQDILSRVEVCSVFDAPIEELGALIQHTSIYLANDSGPMHIARGLGIPTVAIFGSTSPEQFQFGNNTYVFSKQDCSPCHFYGRKSCPKKHLDCLTSIEVDDVWNSLKELSNGL